MENLTQPISGFNAVGLSPAVLSALAAAGLTIPTPIQSKAIPVAMQDVDLIGVAQTGTGKTLAFALPLLEKLRARSGKALILAPTRELALQIEESIQKISARLNPPIRTTTLIGGMSMNNQIKAIRMNPRIVIATPGRLWDHMQQRTIDLSGVTTLILDEADRMLDMGFLPQIRRIIKAVPVERQTMLFSATMAPEVAKLAAEYMYEPVRVEVAKPGTAAAEIEQQLCYVNQDRKPEMLERILLAYEGSVLVFSRTKHGAAKLNRRLQMAGHNATEIHSNKSLSQRRFALDGFKSGKFRVLVATDVAARGIDVHDIALVVNYDLPDVAEDYVHRIGRTGRAGKHGLAISLAGHEQHKDVRAIESLMNRQLPLSEFSEARIPNYVPINVSNTPRVSRQPGRFQGMGTGSRPRRQSLTR